MSTADKVEVYYHQSISVPFLDGMITNMRTHFFLYSKKVIQGLSFVPAIMVNSSSDSSKINELADFYSNNLPSPST